MRGISKEKTFQRLLDRTTESFRKDFNEGLEKDYVSKVRGTLGDGAAMMGGQGEGGGRARAAEGDCVMRVA